VRIDISVLAAARTVTPASNAGVGVGIFVVRVLVKVGGVVYCGRLISTLVRLAPSP
jgi:hypothetical protein